jgi:hypothetical protein
MRRMDDDISGTLVERHEAADQGRTTTDTDPGDLSRRYISMWNEPDAGLRRNAIQRLWAADGTHVLRPPAEIREVAAGLGFESTTLEAYGHDAIELRVTRTHERFVASGLFTFQPRDNAVRLHNIVKFTWESVPADGGPPAGGGLEILVLDDDGRIRIDYMFPGS